MKVHFLVKLKEGPSGGGNHFLYNLREEFRFMGLYAESPSEATVILINSHNSFYDFKEFDLSQLLKGKTVVHRMDGLQKLYNRPDDERQDVALYSNGFADYTIFQSEWSMREYEKFKDFHPCWVIHNAPSREFVSRDFETKMPDNRIRIITSSWSKNVNKGFDDLSYIDKEILPKRPDIEFSFVGNSPVNFENITMYAPMDRLDLSDLILEHDIYFHPSRFEACSNSLLEGLGCKLPCVYSFNGSNGEIVGRGGVGYTNKEDILATIEEVATDYIKYRKGISIETMNSVAKAYASAFVVALSKNNIKRLKSFQSLKIMN